MSFIRVSEPNVGDVALDDLGITIPQATSGFVLSDKFAVGDLVRSADLEAAIIGGALTVELDYGTGWTAVSAGDYTNRDTLGTFLNVYEITNENNNEDLVDGSDVNASGPASTPLHIHDARYFTETELSDPTGGDLIGVDDTAWDPTLTFNTVQEFIDQLAGYFATYDLDDAYTADVDGILNVDDPSKPLEFRSDNVNDILITRTDTIDVQNALLFDVSASSLELGSLAVGALSQIDVHILSNLIVDGNITFTGTITDTTVNELNVTNANILLRDGAASGADASIDVERGVTGDDATLHWNETIDRWEAGLETDKYIIALRNFDEVVEGDWTFQGSSSDAPAVKLTQKICATPPTGDLGAAGQIPFAPMDDGQLYMYDKTNARNKWLSVARKQIMFTGRNNPNNKDEYLWLGQINSQQTGYRIEHESTIVGLAVESKDTNTYTVHLRKNNALANIASLTVTADTGNQTIALNVDVAEGDEIQAYLASATGVEAPVVHVIYANRCG